MRRLKVAYSDYYRVARNVGGSGWSIGDVIPAEGAKRSLIRQGYLIPCGPPAAEPKPEPKAAASVATQAPSSASDEGSEDGGEEKVTRRRGRR